MEANIWLLLACVAALLVCLYLANQLWRINRQLAVVQKGLADIKNGNLNRRILVADDDRLKQICYDINGIAVENQTRLIRQKQSEQAYKRLMTSLSHDVKTPLSSLVGYLEAVETGLVTGAEKDNYIGVANEKARHLQHFVETLFEWVKLDSGEQVFHFEPHDLNELTRELAADWVPVLEGRQITYDIIIPESEYSIRLDAAAYTRIVNNLLQNVLAHSGGSHLRIEVTEDKTTARLVVADNGKGISPADLPHIFERMYQGDHSRNAVGNGLGLAIVQELVHAHHGTIAAASAPGAGAAFTVTIPKAL